MKLTMDTRFVNLSMDEMKEIDGGVGYYASPSLGYLKLSIRIALKMASLFF